MDKKMKHIVIGLNIPDRINQACTVQEILTEYGCSIKTRVGLHAVSETYCANEGLLLLEMFGEEDRMDEMVAKLKNIKGIDVQYMVFQHNFK